MDRVIFGGVGVDGLRQFFYMIWARLLLGDLTLNCYIWIIPFSHKALFGDRFKVEMSQFPVISRINDDLSKLEAFKVSHPSKQPDCPEESRE